MAGVGNVLAHYEILEKIGAGGMGEVYRASDPRLRRDVAVKILPAHVANDADRMSRFKREAQLLASLNHPNIGAIYGLEESNGTHALVLELIEGETLAERISAGPIPPEEATRIALQIAAALESAHEQRIIHRDLKPANVKITPEGNVKVLDFGLAKALEDDPTESSISLSPTFSIAATRAGMILGTAPYMSPEQARGKRVDRRSDIWSFGVVLFEMLVGSQLFTGDTISDTLASILKTEPDWTSLPTDTPLALHRLLRRCLDPDPTTRLRDIGEARIALDGIRTGDENDPVPTSLPKPRRSAVLYTGIAAGIVAIAAVASFVGWSLRPGDTEPPLRKFEIPVEDINTSLGSGTTMALSPDGTRLAYTSEGALWIRDFRELEPQPLAGTDGAALPFWSPNGEWLAFGSARKLQKIRATGGQPIVLCEVPSSFNPASGGVWRPDGRIIFCTGNEGLLEVSSQGGDYHPILETDPKIDDDFHNVSDLAGRGLVFVVHKKEGGYNTLAVFAGGKRKTILELEGQSISFPIYSSTGHVLYHRSPTNAGVWALPFSLSKMDPTGEAFLVAPDATLPVLSAEGTMAFVRGSTASIGQLAWVDRNGAVVGPIGEPADMAVFPAVSPDGRFVAITVVEGDNEDIWIHDTARNTRTRFTFAEDEQFSPSWSPDGQYLFYVSGSILEEFTIIAKRADGTGEPHPITRGFHPSVSPDGKILAFATWDGDSKGDLCYLSLTSGLPDSSEVQVVSFLATDANEFTPRISPDGRYLAYRSNESGRSEIYIRSFPSGSGKWQVSANGGFWPAWKQDGRELYYVEEDKISAVSVRTAPALSLGTPEILFTREPSNLPTPFNWPGGFAVTPDGQRFVVLKDAGAEEDRARIEGIAVVQNWYAEFADRR